VVELVMKMYQEIRQEEQKLFSSQCLWKASYGLIFMLLFASCENIYIYIHTHQHMNEKGA